MGKHRFVVIVEQDEDGNYVGSVPDLKGCHSYGTSMDEMLKNVKVVNIIIMFRITMIKILRISKPQSII